MKHISLIAAAYALLAGATGFSQGLSVVNPSFETPVEPSGSDTVIQRGAGSSSAAPGWSIVSTGGIFAIDNDQSNPSNALVNQNGSQYLVDAAFPASGYSGAGTVTQVLSSSFTVGAEYGLFVWAGSVSGLPAQLGDTIFIANSSGMVLASTSLDTAPTNGSLAQFFVGYTSTGVVGDTGPIEVGFTSPTQTNVSNMAVDDFILGIAVPEPNLRAMAAMGGLVCCIRLAGSRRGSATHLLPTRLTAPTTTPFGRGQRRL